MDMIPGSRTVNLLVSSQCVVVEQTAVHNISIFNTDVCCTMTTAEAAVKTACCFWHEQMELVKQQLEHDSSRVIYPSK